jgi:methylated-DNA-[protein]-cysteine S-methyltransferase
LAELRHTYYQSPIGLLKIGGTEAYIAEVNFHDSSRKPETRKKPIPPLLIQCVEELIQYFNGQRRTFDLPLHQEGSAFQRSVWAELMQIPFAKTISYQELARRTGDPRATRAVAAANGRNAIAILVPCHRVIGVNKDLIGYAGGLWRKKWLLDHEARIAFGVQTLF